MYTEIYGDIYILVNFTMDYIALYITSRILKRRAGKARMIISALIGAVYALLLLVYSGNSLISFILTLFSGGLLTYIAFGKKGFITTYLIYIMSSFLLGGTMTLIFSLLRKIMPGISFSGNAARGGFFIAAVICFFLSLIFSRLSEKCHSKSVCSVSTEISGVTISEQALCDSGNLLREPISGLPVVILCNSLSNKILHGKKSDSDDVIMNDLSNERIRIIPSKMSGDDSGMLMAVIPRHFYVDGVDMMCAVAFGKNEDFGGFRVLVPESISKKLR